MTIALISVGTFVIGSLVALYVANAILIVALSK